MQSIIQENRNYQLKMLNTLSPDGWNEFASQNHIDLAGIDLSGAYLRNRNFSQGSFEGTNFTGADLANSNFSKANLNQADFTVDPAKGSPRLSSGG